MAPNILIFVKKFSALAHEVAGRRPALKVSVWMPSVTVHSHCKHWCRVQQRDENILSILTRVYLPVDSSVLRRAGFRTGGGVFVQQQIATFYICSVHVEFYQGDFVLEQSDIGLFWGRILFVGDFVPQ